MGKPGFPTPLPSPPVRGRGNRVAPRPCPHHRLGDGATGFPHAPALTTGWGTGQPGCPTPPALTTGWSTGQPGCPIPLPPPPVGGRGNRVAPYPCPHHRLGDGATGLPHAPCPHHRLGDGATGLPHTPAPTTGWGTGQPGCPTPLPAGAPGALTTGWRTSLWQPLRAFPLPQTNHKNSVPASGTDAQLCPEEPNGGLTQGVQRSIL